METDTLNYILTKRIQKVIDQIIDQYAYSNSAETPWIIGFSGGKDSTVLLTLVWKALLQIRNLPTPFQLKRPVHVVCNDTMVENPIISSYVKNVLAKIESEARDQNLPIFVKQTTPDLQENYWINVIGKGYPVPTNGFRWCTDKLKIRPTSKFLYEQIDNAGEAIVLLGTRYEESKSREVSMKKHEINGSRLSKHATDQNTYVFAPLKELMLEEVWYIINSFDSPWGFDNSILFKIYSDASADDYECPTVVTTDKHTSCGQSRFGCWTCTVVKKDKSMSALVENGLDWLKPLLDFRNKLLTDRNLNKNRSDKRRRGQVAVDEEGNRKGAYEFHYRTTILRELLEMQFEIQKRKPEIQLIANQELIAIQVIWNRDGYFDNKVGDIYQKIYGKDLSTNNLHSMDGVEQRILKEICVDVPEYSQLIDKLLTIQETKALLLTKYGVHNDVENQISKFVEEDDP